VTVSTERAPQAFRDVGPGDYQQPSDQPRLQTRPPVGAGPYPYYGPAYGPYYGYPYYYGPRVSIGFGYGYYGGRYRRWR